MNFQNDTKSYDNLWRLFLRSLYALFSFVFLMLVLIPLQNPIKEYFNKKVYSKQELASIEKRSIAQESREREERTWNLVQNGIHLRTGLFDDPNLEIIISACTSCHSSKLIIQNKATRTGWASMIDWMQKTQGLPDLGKSEPIILDYLSKYYAPNKKGRRQNLNKEKIEWYVLSLPDSK